LGLFKRKVEFSCEISPRFLFLKLWAFLLFL
jgi:hypothetical protein